MSAFVRIELHEKSAYDKPSSDAYSKLHELLSQKSIERNVQVTTVGNQTLPSGFYYTPESDKSAIGQDVHWAAKQVGYPYSYVVVLSNGSLVYNLAACQSS